MRSIIPERINKLSDKIAPYMEFDEAQKGFFLRDDAPPEIVAAQKEFHAWMAAQKDKPLR